MSKTTTKVASAATITVDGKEVSVTDLLAQFQANAQPETPLTQQQISEHPQGTCALKACPYVECQAWRTINEQIMWNIAHQDQEPVRAEARKALDALLADGDNDSQGPDFFSGEVLEAMPMLLARVHKTAKAEGKTTKVTVIKAKTKAPEPKVEPKVEPKPEPVKAVEPKEPKKRAPKAKPQRGVTLTADQAEHAAKEAIEREVQRRVEQILAAREQKSQAPVQSVAAVVDPNAQAKHLQRLAALVTHLGMTRAEAEQALARL